MPLGINRTDLNGTGTTYKGGTPVSLPLTPGTPVSLPKNYGNPVPSSGTNNNVVNWTPNPNHFGNILAIGSVTNGFLLEDSSGLFLLEDGSFLLQEV